MITQVRSHEFYMEENENSLGRGGDKLDKLPPMFGHFCCRLAVQPYCRSVSLVSTLWSYAWLLGQGGACSLWQLGRQEGWRQVAGGMLGEREVREGVNNSIRYWLIPFHVCCSPNFLFSRSNWWIGSWACGAVWNFLNKPAVLEGWSGWTKRQRWVLTIWCLFIFFSLR